MRTSFFTSKRPTERRVASFSQSTPDTFECISRRRSAWCTKAELSDRADSETPRRLPPMQNMYYIGLDVHKRTISYCVKDGSGTIHAEGTIPATRFDLERPAAEGSRSKFFRGDG